MDWVLTRVLVSIWAVPGWCVLGLATGLCADLAYRYLPSRLSERWRAILTGLTVGIATFAAVTIALSFFYIKAETIYSANYFSVAYYGVPFMLGDKSRPVCRSVLVLAEAVRKRLSELETEEEPVLAGKGKGKKGKCKSPHQACANAPMFTPAASCGSFGHCHGTRLPERWVGSGSARAPR
jgi:hypothetical protein